MKRQTVSSDMKSKRMIKRGPAEKRAHLSNFSQFNSFLQCVSTLLNLFRKFLHDEICMTCITSAKFFKSWNALYMDNNKEFSMI